MKRLILINLTSLALLLGASNAYTSKEAATPIITFYLKAPGARPMTINMSPDNQTVTVIGDTIWLSPDHTVRELKDAIKKSLPEFFENRQMSFENNGKILEDDKQLKDSGIKNGDKLFWIIRWVKIHPSN